ncbi:MAG: TIGR02921 family PEP-CTERM protein [Anaerolineales bacterium]
MNPFLRRDVWAYGLFWSWNVIFIAFMLLGFAPLLLPQMIVAAQAGEIPQVFLVTAAILPVVPVIVVILGATLLRHSPGRLFALGYGVEGPLMLLLAVRLFAVRELMPAVAVLLVIAALGLLTYLWDLLDQNIDTRGTILTHVRGFGLTLLLFTGVYVGVWIAFYAVPFAVLGLRGLMELLANLGDVLSGLWRSLINGGLAWLPFSVLGFTLFIYSATLFVLMPIAIPVLYLRAWWRGMRVLMTRHGLPSSVAVVGGVFAVTIAAIALTIRQPQQLAFDLLKDKPTSPAEARTLLNQQESIRAGLLNSFLAPFRYLSAVGELQHIQSLYWEAFRMTTEETAQVQGLYEVVARPVLYEPVPNIAGDGWVMNRDSQRAAEMYERFFDQPIVKAERRAVVNAARSSWSPEQARAAWQAVDEREIHLHRQEVTVTEHGDWAEIELYEVYQNRTSERQEVVYYFSLPESAVITGVWLGNSAERSERFVYRVAPRGAAQAVYQSQVRVRLDPALVEQIGPRQYRLRIFPIEPQRTRWESEFNRRTIEPGPEMHMWLTWRVLAAGNAWPMPRLAEKFNVYWDDGSVRVLNGQPLNADEDTWLPASMAASALVTPTMHHVDFGDGQSVIAQPLSPAELPQPDSGLRLAVVVDRSRSMAAHAAEVQTALARLREIGALADVYLTASEYRGEAASRATLAEVDAGEMLYFGGQNPAQLLQQFAALRVADRYDAVLVLTDESGYELGPSDAPVPASDAPVWMVHLGGDFPLGYDDATLEAIQASGGGAAGSVDEALTRLQINVVDGYQWETIPTVVGDVPVDADFAPFAARQLILSTLPNPRLAADRLDVLDGLHKIAIENSIVTPYSSMIVLVTPQQEQLLKDAESRADRFEREFEQVGETSTLNVTGVPEPHEWLLLALVVGMLAMYVIRTRRATQIAGAG